jgi:hypothetical protein
MYTSSSQISQPFFSSPLILHLRGVITRLPLALSVDKATAATVRLSRASSAHVARGTVTTKFSAETEEDGSQEEAGYRRPGEAHEVATNACVLACGAECVASFDDPGAVRCQFDVIEGLDACEDAYVMRAAANAWKNSATKVVMDEMYPPRRLTSARRPVMRATAAKNSAIR